MNYGLLTGKRQNDYLGGTLPYEVRNESGDWTAYLPLGEWQANSHVDTMACVTFSALNSIETQYKFLTGQDRNFSDRFTARMSGTTSQGNWLFRVADSIRRDGLVDEAAWPSPADFTWDSYYATPPIEIINQASIFLTNQKRMLKMFSLSIPKLMVNLTKTRLCWDTPMNFMPEMLS